MPEKLIRANLLRLTPVGTDMKDAIAVIESNKKWEIMYISNEFGYMLTLGGMPETYYPRYSPDILPEKIIGKQSIRATLGSYRTIFITSVVAFWGFDENSKLIDIHVRKEVDAL